MTTSITFIDGNLSNLNSLIAGLPANTTYFVLDPNQDGLRQMTKLLADYHDLSAIHVISHGASGSIRLGTTLLNQDSLDDHTE